MIYALANYRHPLNTKRYPLLENVSAPKEGLRARKLEASAHKETVFAQRNVCASKDGLCARKRGHPLIKKLYSLFESVSAPIEGLCARKLEACAHNEAVSALRKCKCSYRWFMRSHTGGIRS